MPIYLVCDTEEVAAPAAGCHLVRPGFRLATDYPSLLGPEAFTREDGAFLLLQDGSPPPYEPTAQLACMLLTLCAERRGGLFCDFAGPPHPFWQTLARLLDQQAAKWSLPLLVPEAYADCVQTASVLLSPPPGPMSYRRWAEAAASGYPGRAVVRLEPLRMDVALPSATGTALTEADLAATMAARTPAIFRDDDLLCDYFGYLEGETLHLVLYDTAETLSQKQQQAEAAGCAGVCGQHAWLPQYR